MHKNRTFLMLLAALLALPIGARAQGTITIGNGTSTYYHPLPGWYGWQYEVYIYTPTDAEELDQSISISSIGFDNTTSTSSTGAQLEIWLKDVDANYTLANATTFADFTNNATLVYSNTAFSSTTGWNTLQLSDEFIHEGGNALLVIVRDVGCSTSGSCARSCRYTTATGAHWYKRQDSSDPGTSASGTVDEKRANIQIAYDDADPNACRKVKGLSADATENSITLNWIDTSNAAGATYSVAVVDGTDTTVLATGLSAMTYTATGLTANTAYTYLVKTSCSADNESGWASVIVRTLCDAITLPWFEGFESNTSSQQVPFCWSFLYNNTSSSTGSHYVSTTHHGGANSYYMYPYGAMYLVSQALPLSADQYEISFWAQVSNSANLQVGFMTDPDSMNTFVPIKEIAGNSNTWTEYVVYTDTVSISGTVYLAFRGYASNGYAVYIDDINVAQATDCRRVLSMSAGNIGHYTATLSWVPGNDNATTYEVRYSTVDNVYGANVQSVTGVTDTTIDLDGLLPYTTYYAWVRAMCGEDSTVWCRIGNSFTTDRSCYPVSNLSVESVNYSSALVSWQYTGGGRGLDETGVHFTLRDSASIVREWDVTMDEGTQTFVTGLEPASTYTLEARTLCDPDSATTSVLVIQTTTCGEVSTVASGTTSTGSSYSYPMYGYYSDSYSTYSQYKSASQILYPASAASGMQSISGISFYLSSASYAADITADVYLAYTDKAEFTSSSDMIDTALFTCVARDAQFHTGTTAGWVDINFDTPFATGGNGQNIAVMLYTKSIVSTSSYPYIYWRYHYNTSTQGYVTLYSYSSSSSSNGNVAAVLGSYNHSRAYYRPHIRFNGACDLSCLAPNLAIAGTDVNSVDLRWAKGGDESQWAVQYRLDSVAAWADAPAPADTVATVGGLNAKSHYHFRVGSICDNDTVWSNAASTWTGCEPLEELPYAEGFEQMPTNIDPLCWTVVDYRTTTGSSHYVQTGTKHNGQQAMNVYPYGVTYVVAPKLPDGTDPAELEINYWAYLHNSGQRYEVGLMTDPTDTNTFEVLFTSAGNGSTWQEYTVYGAGTSLTSSDPVYVAWRYYVNNGYNCYLDDVTISLSTCRRPTNLRVDGLTHESATISWSGMDEGSYEYCLTTTNAQPTDTVELLSGTDTAYTFTGLQGSTTYYVWVRTVCDGNATSWSSTFSFRTTCAPESLPYIENFNNWGSTFSQCWSRFSGQWNDANPTTPTSTSTNWSVSSGSYGSINMSGYALTYNLYSTNRYDWVISPYININGNAVLKFDIAVAPWSTGALFDNDDRFIVAASTDGTHWTPLYMMGANSTRDDRSLQSLSNTYTTITVPMVGYAGQSVRIAFYGGSQTNTTDNRVVIDNIEVMDAACMRPTVTSVNPDMEEVTFIWQDLSSDNQEGYVLVVSPADSINAAGAQTFNIAVGDTSFTVTGLTGNTGYHYFLRSACSETVSNNSWYTGSFRTLCAPMTFPYVEGFENMPSGNGNLPFCWDVVRTGTSSADNAYVYSSSAHSGSQCMYFYPYNYSYLISQALPADIDPAEVEINFWAKVNSSGSSSLEVGLMTDPTDLSTFRSMTTIGSNGSTWTEYTVYTDTTTLTADQTVYVAFRFYCNNGYGNYLDDIHIGNAGCRRPASISAGATTPYTATLSWSEVTDAEGYRVKYSTENSIANADSADFSDNEGTVSGLLPGTTYYAWVQALCADGGISDPRGPVSFTTEISCYPITNVRLSGSSKTSASIMWDIDTRGNDAVEVLYTLRDMADSSVVDSGSTNGLTYNLFSGLTVGHLYEATLRTVCTVDSASSVVFSFGTTPESCVAIEGSGADLDRLPFHTLYNYGYSQMIYTASELNGVDSIYGIAYNVTSVPADNRIRTLDVYVANTSRTGVSTSNYMPVDSLTAVATNITLDASSTGWKTINFSTPFAYDGTSNLMIAVQNKTGSWRGFNFACHTAVSGRNALWYSDYSACSAANPGSGSPSTYDTISSQPDILFFGNCDEENTCEVPVVAVTDVDSTSASVVWLGNSESYTVQYRLTSDTAWTSQTATASPATISGLQPGTRYFVRVSGICNDAQYTSAAVSFMTDCAPVHIPFHYGQADLIANYSAGFSPCWSYSNTVYRSYNNGVYYVYSSTNGAWFALPEIAEPINTTQVRFTTATTASNVQMRVGVMESDQSVTWVDTIAVPQTANSYTGNEQVVYLDSYAGTGNRVVFGCIGSSSVYIHDMNVEPLDACRIVTDVAVSNIGESTATVSWTAVEGQTQWLVYLNDTLIGTANAATYSLTGLSAMTQYTVGIRAYCGGTDTARMATTSFHTTCGSITELPWYEDFEAVGAELHTSYPNAMTGDIMPCWDFTPSGSAAHMSFAYNNSSYTYGGGSAGYSLCFYPGVVGGNNIVALPVFAENISGLKMSYVTRPEGTSSSPGVFDVGYVTNVADSSSFVSVKHYSYSDFNNAYILDTVVFTNAPAGARIAFRHKANASNWYWFVDSIVVDYNGSTPGPQPGNCVAPTVTNVTSTANSVTLTWTSTESNFEVAIVEGSWSEPANATAVSGTQHTFSGLSASTQYTAGVRTVCADGQHSAWVTRSIATQNDGSGEGIASVDGMDFSLYPNPASSMVSIEASEAVSVSVIDQSGRVVYRSKNDAAKHSVDVSQMAKGAYYVRLTGQNGTAVRKLVVK